MIIALFTANPILVHILEATFVETLGTELAAACHMPHSWREEAPHRNAPTMGVL